MKRKVRVRFWVNFKIRVEDLVVNSKNKTSERKIARLRQGTPRTRTYVVLRPLPQVFLCVCEVPGARK